MLSLSHCRKSKVSKTQRGFHFIFIATEIFYYTTMSSEGVRGEVFPTIYIIHCVERWNIIERAV